MAAPGALVRVAQGTYNEILVITKSLILQEGQDAAYTIRTLCKSVPKGIDRGIEVCGGGIDLTTVTATSDNNNEIGNTATNTT